MMVLEIQLTKNVRRVKFQADRKKKFAGIAFMQEPSLSRGGAAFKNLLLDENDVFNPKNLTVFFRRLSHFRLFIQS